MTGIFNARAKQLINQTSSSCQNWRILQALQSKNIDSVFVCCGGGGMLAGVAAYIKALNPEVKVFGVEADDAAGTYR